MSKISRRKFLATGTVAAAGLTIVPSTVLGKSMGYKAPSDRLNIAGVGVGGHGRTVLRRMNSENIIGIADVDHARATAVFNDYPNAPRWFDYREMYDRIGSSIDAVVVASSDHTHAIIAADAATMGKHLFVEKPLTHNVYESRLLAKLAAHHRIATSMGNQGASWPGVRQIVDWIHDGQIGDVTKVDAWTNRPIWPQGQLVPEGPGDPIPDTMRWDLFIGPAEMRTFFRSIYTPWNFRGWWDFGTGALGDMAPHVMHPLFKALNLGHPIKIQGSSTQLLHQSAPHAQKVKIVFPSRPNLPKVAFPEVEVTWYDGGLMPFRPEGVPVGRQIGDGSGGLIFHGTKDTLICGCYGRNPWLVSGRTPNSPKTMREVPARVHVDGDGHWQDFVRAAKENPNNRVETASPFSEAGPFNEMVAMCAAAIRLQGLRQELHWDGDNMRFTNIPAETNIRHVIEASFIVRDGHPTGNNRQTEPVNAQQFAANLIKAEYHNGWALPAMPS